MPTPRPVSRRGFLGASAAVGAVPLLTPHDDAAATPRLTDTGSTPNVLKVSSLGHNLADSTEFLQQALDSTADTVIIDHVPGGWTTRPLFIRRSDLVVIVEPEVMVRPVAGGFPGANDSLLTITDQSNVTISGYGATFAMNKPEYKTGEWRMAIQIKGCSDLTVEGLVLRDSGGDGVYLGRGLTHAVCTDIVLRDLVCDNHRRQGLSVVTAERLTIEGCAFLNTNGTAPQSGVDFEPNKADERLADIVMRDCVCLGNLTNGIQLYGGQLRPTSHPVSITIERTTVGEQIGGSPQIMVSSAKATFPGLIEVKDSLIRGGTGSSSLGTLGNGPAGIRTKATRTVMWERGNAFQYYWPLELLSRGVTNYGNLELEDVVIHTDQSGPFLHADAVAGTTVHAVHGNVTVVGPASAPDLGPDPQDVDLKATLHAELPNATVRIRAERGTVSGGQTATLVFTRSGDDSLPLAVAFATAGSARERYDYGGLGKVAVFAPGSREVKIAVRTFARRRPSEPAIRDLVVTAAAGHGYHAQPGAAQIRIHG